MVNEAPSTVGQQERDELYEALNSESKDWTDVFDPEQMLAHAIHPAKDLDMDAGTEELDCTGYYLRNTEVKLSQFLEELQVNFITCFSLV